jgi:hypothetical protein
MTAKAGERAQQTGDFYCDSCGEKVHVTQVGVSIWSDLYGPEGVAAVERDGLQWQQWLDERAATPD